MSALSAAAKAAAAALQEKKNGYKVTKAMIILILSVFLVPLLIVYGLFGWMSTGKSGMDLGELSEELEPLINGHNKELGMIREKLIKNGACESEIKRAQYIFLYGFTGNQSDDKFFDDFTACFCLTDDGRTVYDRIKDSFGLDIPEKDRDMLDEICIKTGGG